VYDEKMMLGLATILLAQNQLWMTRVQVTLSFHPESIIHHAL
jgi:hypothetical protein